MTHIEAAFVQRFFPLVDHTNKEVVLSFLEAMPAIANHSMVQPKNLLRLMNLLLHEDNHIAEAFSQNISAFITHNSEEKVRAINCACVLKFYSIDLLLGKK